MTLADYGIPVHSSLQEPDVFMGVGVSAFLLIMMTTVMLMTLISFWCLFIGITSFLVMRFLCKNDPFLVDILLECIGQPDLYTG